MVSAIRLQGQIKQIQVINNIAYIVMKMGSSTQKWQINSQIVSQWQIELQIVDVSDPLNPSKLGFYRPEFSGVDVVVIDNVAHVFGLKDNWDVVDVSNPNMLTKIGTISEGYRGSCSGCPMLLHILERDGNLHLVGGVSRYSTSSVVVYDVFDPLNPELISWLRFPKNSNTLDVIYSGKDAYTVHNFRRRGVVFRILGFSDPDYLNVVGELVLELPETYIQDGGLAVVDHYVYLASSDGFYVIDVLDRFRPSLANTLYPNAYFSDIVKVNDFVYLLDWDNGLIILDVSDPVNPVEIGRWHQQ